jgi:hypothetical protein
MQSDSAIALPLDVWHAERALHRVLVRLRSCATSAVRAAATSLAVPWVNKWQRGLLPRRSLGFSCSISGFM